jgi:hypothetical protein
MNANVQPAGIRGPLKFSVETSSPQIEAGKRFSVSVRISNPYDVPVTVRGVGMRLPAKFVMTSQRHRTMRQRFLDLFTAAEMKMSGGAIAVAVSPLPTPPPGRAGEALDEVDERFTAVQLQPGNSIVRVFTLVTKGWLFFPPSTYNLNVEVEYEIDGRTNRDTIAYQMSVRSPLRAIIAGAISGALIGFFVRDTGASGQQLFIHVLGNSAPEAIANPRLMLLVALLTAVIIASMVVVAFARKKDAQPILSIEDFYGGLFIGFLSAYGGSALLQQVIGTEAGSG